MNDQETKDAMKEALKEWLDAKILLFGHWSIYTIAASGLFALVYFIISFSGLHK